MFAELIPNPAVFWSGLLALARVAGVVALVPVPGWRMAIEPARIVLAFALAVALFPFWPEPPSQTPGLGQMAGWILMESAFGLVLGLGVSLLIEMAVLAAQMAGLQAGYGYASTIDPTSEADSSILQILAHLCSSLLFFSFGMEQQLLRALARSFQKQPPGQWWPTGAHMESIVALGADMWIGALRLALPVVALLFLVDLSLALLSRIHAQLQLMTLAFPAKMLVTLAMFAMLAGALPVLFRQQAERTVAAWAR